MSCRFPRKALLPWAFALFLLPLSQLVEAEPTLFTFTNADNPLAAAAGPGTLQYYDPSDTGWGPVETRFGKASSFGVPPLNGVDPDVMFVPACTPEQGYLFVHGAEPNGAYTEEGLVSNYTLVFDIYYPPESANEYRALWQTDTSNSTDAKFFIHNTTSGLGILGRYLGTVSPGEWHRLVIAMRTGDNEGQAHRYIDGKFVGTLETTGSGLGRPWALEPELLFFTDEDNETRPAYVSSIYFVDRTLTYEEVVALGGPNAAGANVPGPLAPPATELMARRVGVIGHRGGAFGMAPDNTITAIQRAFADGAAGVEIDTRLTADGVAICFHDATLERTTDGFGAVEDHTLAEIKALDAGRKFDPAFAGERVPTVAEALAAAKGKGIVYLDIKTEGQAEALAEALEEADFPVSDVWFWVPGNEAYAAEIRALVPEARILWGNPASNWSTDPNYFNNLKALGVVGFSIGTQNPDPDFCAKAKEAGMFVEVYTINTPEAMRTASLAGVDYIETDFPILAAALQPPVMTAATGPIPSSGGQVYDSQITLNWVAGQGATQHRVHFGTTNPPPFVVEQEVAGYTTPVLEDGKTYYWRIDEVGPGGTIAGEVWSFSTPSAQLGKVLEWTLQGDLEPTLGDGELVFGNGEWTADQVAWEVSDGDIVPHMDGEPVSYLRIPGFYDRADGLALTFNDVPANAGGVYINAYTFVFDVLLPEGWNWAPFFNTNASNANDSDFFVRSNGSVGIADIGYSAASTIKPNTWHRVIWTCDLSAGVVAYFVDGVQVYQREGSSLLDGRFSLSPSEMDPPHVMLFGDNDGETSEMLVSAVAFVNNFITDHQATALGGPKAAGIFPKAGGGAELPSLAVTRDGANIVLTWQGAPGRYLQRSVTLAEGSWTNLSATDGQSSYSEPWNGTGPVFFRLVQE